MALRRTAEGLRAETISVGHFSARLHDVTNLLFGNSLCAAALEEVTANCTAPIAGAAYRRRLNESIAADVSIAARLLQELIPLARSTNPAHQGYLDAANQWLSNEVAFGAQPVQVQVVLSRLTQPSFPDLTQSQLSSVSMLLMNGDNNVRTLKAFAWPTPSEMDSVSQYETASRLAQRTLAAQPQFLGHLDELADAVSLTPIVDDLRALHQETADLLRGEAGPMTSEAGLARVWTGHRMRYIANVERLTALITARLSLGIVQQHALHRLRSYLTHFARERISAEWKAEQERADQARQQTNSSRPNRQFEAIIQDHVDGFLFSEGLFPITHADATGGSIDSFVPTRQHLFHEAASTHQRAALLELKAVSWDGGNLKSLLIAAIKRALDQAATYSQSLHANPAWRAHDVVALVVYDGPTRFKTDQSNVMLIYIGDAYASAGSSALE